MNGQSIVNLRYVFIFFVIVILFAIFYMSLISSQDNQTAAKIISDPSSEQHDRIYKLLEELVELNKGHGKNLTNFFVRDLVGTSQVQKDIDPEILYQTLKFMVREVNEYDPELVEFVRSMIIKLDRKFTGAVSIESERDDLRYIDTTLKSMRNGFYIEAGAYSATDHSNSLFFEVNRGWSGILIEPMPWYFNDIKKADRNAYILNACIARKTPLLAKFRIDAWGSGKENQMNEKQKKYIESVWTNNGIPADRRYIYVPCFSLNTIMKALRVNTVDFFSLDVEGSEYEVVQSIDYNQLKIRLIAMEITQSLSNKPNIIKHLEDQNYTLSRETPIDLFFYKTFD